MPRSPGGACRRQRRRPGAAGARPRRLRARCTPSVRRCTSRSPTRSSRRWRARARSPRVDAAALTLRELPAGARLLWATAGSGEYPVLIGDGLLSCDGLRLLAAVADRPAGSRAFCVTDENVARALRRRSSASSPLTVDDRARRAAARRSRGAERVWTALAGAGMTRADHLVALGGGVVGDLAGLLRRDLPARRAGRAGADHARRAGRLGLRRQDRRRPARGEELRRRLPPAGRRARRPGALAHAARRRAGGRLRRGAQDRADRRRRRCGSGCRRRRAGRRDDLRLRAHASSRSSPPTSATAAAARCSTSATPSATRSRPPPATPATATARRSASACSRRCGCPARHELREQVRELLAGARAAGAARRTPTSTRCSTAIRRDKKRIGADVPFVLVDAPGDGPPRALRSAGGELRAAVDGAAPMSRPAQPRSR